MEGLTEMDWMARSSDMNCTENCQGRLSRALYDGGRQFDTVDDLREALVYEWGSGYGTDSKANSFPVLQARWF